MFSTMRIWRYRRRGASRGRNAEAHDVGRGPSPGQHGAPQGHLDRREDAAGAHGHPRRRGDRRRGPQGPRPAALFRPGVRARRRSARRHPRSPTAMSASCPRASSTIPATPGRGCSSCSPPTARPSTPPRPRPRRASRLAKVDTVTVGAGTAGLSALREVRRATDDFLLVHDGHWGTTCAVVGCMPSKVLIEAANAFHRRRAFVA